MTHATKFNNDQLKQQIAFMQEGQEALKTMNSSGLHATEKEVNEWLDSWGTDHESEPPQCHV